MNFLQPMIQRVSEGSHVTMRSDSRPLTSFELETLRKKAGDWNYYTFMIDGLIKLVNEIDKDLEVYLPYNLLMRDDIQLITREIVILSKESKTEKR